MRYSINQVRRDPRSFVDTTVHFRKSPTHSMLVQPKVSPIGQRIRTLQELVYETFMGNLRPSGGPRSKARPDYFFHAKTHIKALAVKGGVEYEHALNAVKFAYTGQTAVEQEQNYLDAVHAVIPPLK